MKKTKYYFLGLLAFLFYGCFDFGCLEYSRGPEPLQPKAEKIVTIINETNKEYKDNFIDAVCPYKSTSDGKWKIYYNKIKIKIGSKKTVTKNDYGNILLINSAGCPNDPIWGKEKLFLLSLDGGKRKIFFGPYHYYIVPQTEQNKKTCTYDFVRWKFHPVWQEKDLTINIYEDRVEFSDPKIKETKKVRLTKTEYVDPHTLPFWWEDN